MATIKAFTDVEQSKKLAKILSTESADMCYLQEGGQAKTISQLKLSEILNVSKPQVIPCWSLAGLLNILPSATLDSSDDHHYRVHCSERFTDWHDNPVDACVAMIERLHELNLL